VAKGHPDLIFSEVVYVFEQYGVDNITGEYDRLRDCQDKADGEDDLLQISLSFPAIA
jgi:hypothetical protein